MTCVIANMCSRTRCAAALRAILASHSERELRQRTRYTTTRPGCDAGDRHPQQIGAVDISLSTPITTLDFVRCASPSSLKRDTTNTNALALTHGHWPLRPAWSATIGNWDWCSLGVGFGCGIWCWYFLGLGLGSGECWSPLERALYHAGDPAPWT